VLGCRSCPPFSSHRIWECRRAWSLGRPPRSACARPTRVLRGQAWAWRWARARTCSWYRNALMRGFHLLVVLVAGSAVKDTQCGFKARRPPTPGLAAVARLRRRKSLGL